MKRRALLICPGRGSYSKENLGSLAGRPSRSLDRIDAWRAAQGRPSVREMDSSPWDKGLHIAGENASILTTGCTLADVDCLPENMELVAVVGNSMGWYSALGAAGALPLEDMAELVDTMGGYQAAAEHGVVGEQLVYPVVADDSWRPHPERQAAVKAALGNIPDLHWSIHLGGQAVLGGSAEAISRAMAVLPPLTFSGATFPRKLPLHSAFHTPLMAATAERARRELAHLRWSAPRIPLVDGQGHIWRPRHADPAALRDWTLGPQVTEAYDFSLMIRTALGEYAPDLLLLPGPGSNLGGAIAQVLIATGWHGLRSRADFLARQATDQPTLWSMRRRAGA